jgi:hypothetical protein
VIKKRKLPRKQGRVGRQNARVAGYQWLKFVIPATQEAEIRRIKVRSQL